MITPVPLIPGCHWCSRYAKRCSRHDIGTRWINPATYPPPPPPPGRPWRYAPA